MTTFAKSTFNAARYATARSIYPQQLYDAVYEYHGQSPNARWEIAVDIGCGTGQITHNLTKFKTVLGIDPSPKMVEQAKHGLSQLAQNSVNEIAFHQGHAEELPEVIRPDSVDLVVAGQAAHWFKFPSVYTSLARAVRHSVGTFAFWGYSELRLSKYPTCTEMIAAYTQGKDPANSLGPYWEQPGRSIVVNHFLDVAPPKEEDGWIDHKQIYFVGDHYPDLQEKGLDTRPVILKKQFTWPELEGYLRSFSSIYSYHEKYPEDAKLQVSDRESSLYEENEGDIAQRFLSRLRAKIREDTGDTNDVLDIEWPMVLVMMRRNALTIE